MRFTRMKKDSESGTPKRSLLRRSIRKGRSSMKSPSTTPKISKPMARKRIRKNEFFRLEKHQELYDRTCSPSEMQWEEDPVMVYPEDPSQRRIVSRMSIKRASTVTAPAPPTQAWMPQPRSDAERQLMEELKQKLALLGPRPSFEGSCSNNMTTAVPNRNSTTSETARQMADCACQTVELPLLSRPSHSRFSTPIDCKYYGSAVSEFVNEASAKCEQGLYKSLIKHVVQANNRQHVPTQLTITDNGLTVKERQNDNDLLLKLVSDEVLAIVPGTLRTKTGKKLTVAVIVEKTLVGEGALRPCHVFQLVNRRDGEGLYMASKRMWETQLFRNLLDASPEQAHNNDLAAIIAQDIALAEKRAWGLIKGAHIELQGLDVVDIHV